MLIAWENEAILALAEIGAGKFEIVTPLGLDPGRAAGGAWSTRWSTRKGTRTVAEGYLNFLYSPLAQDLIGQELLPAAPTAAAAAQVRGAVPEDPAGDHRRRLRRLAQGAGDPLRRRRRLRPDLRKPADRCAACRRATCRSSGRAALRLARALVLPGFAAGARLHAALSGRDRLHSAGGAGAAALGSRLGGVWRVADATPRVLAALRLSASASSLAGGAASTRCWGCIVAWVLVRYEFPGRRVVDALVDLPFALPTAVAGIALAALYAPTGWLGARWRQARDRRSPTRRSASSSRWSSSACRSWCARCSRCWPTSTARSRRRR